MNLGNLNNIRLNLTVPLKIEANCSFRELTILVGQNGTGKSLVLKLNWAMGTIMSMSHALKGVTPSRQMKIGKFSLPEITTLAQFVFDNTFESQNFHGEVETAYENGKLTITLDDGKITELDIRIDEGVDSIPPPVFMSSNLRLFTAIRQLIALREELKDDEKLLKFHKLYDLVYVQRLLGALPCTLDDRVRNLINTTLNNRMESDSEGNDIHTIFLKDNSIWNRDSRGKETDLATLGNGHQAMINMMVGASL